MQLLVADAKRHHLARARAEALGCAHELPLDPVALLAADPEDQVGPVAHGDVPSLAVDVEVARDPARRDGEVAAHAVRAEAEVAQRLELAELHDLSGQRLRDDRPGDVTGVLARAVVVEHPRDDAWEPERVVVVHRQEVGRDLRGRVHGFGIDRRALVQDQAAGVVEVVLVRDRLPHVSVLLGGAGGVELLQLEPVVDDRLEQVQRPERVCHHRLVGPVPGLADVRLRAQVEDIRPVLGLEQVLDQIVDRRLVGEIGEVDADAVAEMADVVERAARRGAHERVDVSVELDERFRQMVAHEAVGARDEAGPAAEHVAEVVPQGIERFVRPGGV